MPQIKHSKVIPSHYPTTEMKKEARGFNKILNQQKNYNLLIWLIILGFFALSISNFVYFKFTLSPYFNLVLLAPIILWMIRPKIKGGLTRTQQRGLELVLEEKKLRTEIIKEEYSGSVNKIIYPEASNKNMTEIFLTWNKDGKEETEILYFDGIDFKDLNILMSTIRRRTVYHKYPYLFKLELVSDKYIFEKDNKQVLISRYRGTGLQDPYEIFVFPPKGAK